MITSLILLGVLLLAVIAVQIGRLTELAEALRDPEQVQFDRNRLHATLGLVFLVVFLGGCIGSAYYYSESFPSFAGNMPASAHGKAIDDLFYLTTFFTGIVFILCHIALFWFAYKYRGRKGAKAIYMPHDNRLEIVWTALPAIVMTILVIGGLRTWNDVMADIKEGWKPGKDYIEIEATGMQFAWILRHPGKDGLLGKRFYKNITGINSLGQDWTDTKNHDDILTDEIVLPVNKPVRVRITSRDVLHNFYLPQFRLKMDAVPGMPTYFVFTPTVTTEQRRKELSKLESYQENDANGKPRWSSFNYELACAEICGQGHFSMRRVVRIVPQAEYDKWLNDQKPYYLTSIKGTENDTYGKVPVTNPSESLEKKEEGKTSDATKNESKLSKASAPSVTMR